MSALSNLVGSNSPWAAQRAQNALDIQTAVQAGQMTKAEATELLNDLIAGDSLDKVADNFTIRTQLVNAIQDLITVVEGLSSL
jgi:polyhydroxyalkanoate synthesis regulator phasin